MKQEQQIDGFLGNDLGYIEEDYARQCEQWQSLWHTNRSFDDGSGMLPVLIKC